MKLNNTSEMGLSELYNKWDINLEFAYDESTEIENKIASFSFLNSSFNDPFWLGSLKCL